MKKSCECVCVDHLLSNSNARTFETVGYLILMFIGFVYCFDCFPFSLNDYSEKIFHPSMLMYAHGWRIEREKREKERKREKEKKRDSNANEKLKKQQLLETSVQHIHTHMLEKKTKPFTILFMLQVRTIFQYSIRRHTTRSE